MTAKILIVDGSAKDRRELENILCATGYTVITACSWKNALSKKHAEKPDLTLMDLAILTENRKRETEYEVRKWMRQGLLFIFPQSTMEIEDIRKKLLYLEVIFIAPMAKLQKPYIAEEVIKTVKQMLMFLAAKPG